MSKRNYDFDNEEDNKQYEEMQGDNEREFVDEYDSYDEQIDVDENMQSADTSNDYNEQIDNEDNYDKVSFLHRLKDDERYRAKLQLIGYVVFVVVVVIFLRISNLSKNYNYNTVNKADIKEDTKDNTVNDDKDLEKEENLLEQIEENYTYNVDVDFSKLDDSNNVLEYKWNYNGKSSLNNMIINKVENDATSAYFKVNNKYYVKDADSYKDVSSEDIYGDLGNGLIELWGLKKFISNAKLDHFTNYSSGKKEYVYNLFVSDIVPNYKETDSISIGVILEADIIVVNVDYTNLLIHGDAKIKSCKISYTYKDIGKVENFNIMDTTVVKEGN